MDKSLDEYAKENKINSRARGGGANRRGGARRGAGANSGNQTGNRFNRSFNARRSGGGIQKRRSAGGAASLSPTKAAAASINGQWSHDLYQNGNALNSNRFRRATSAGALGAGPGPAKLVISNLDFGVNDSDIQGLFQEFGKIRKAAVHYDRSGRSLGTADVLFERKQDAIRALTHYNGVSLDGRPMNIQLTASLSALGNGGNGPRRSLGNGGGVRRGGRGGNRGNRGGRAAGQKKQVKSAADLDAELDAHNAKMQTD